MKINLKSTLFALMATSMLCFASTANAQSSDYYMSMPDVQATGGGTVTVPISLNNVDGIMSLQIEVYLPDGVDVVSIEGSERTANAEFFNYAQNDQTTDDGQRYRRIFIANIQTPTSAISGNEGELIYITFQLPEGEGVYPIQLKNLQFFAPPTYTVNYMEDVVANITAADYYFTIPDVQVSCDETFTVPLNLHNAGGVYSIQIDLMLADGVEFVDATLGERVNAEFFQFGEEDKYTTDGLRYRRLIFANIMSTESTLSDNEGIVVYYTLKVPKHAEASYPLRVMNVQYFNPPTYELHYIADAEATINVSPTILYGDVNHDGITSIGDVTALIDLLLGVGTGCEICGDVNQSGNLSIGDVTALIDILLGVN